MTAPIDVTWQAGGGRYIIADKHPNGEWKFAEKYSGEERWYPLDSTPELIATAEALLAQRTSASAPLPLSLHCHPGP